ncbi:hypothetical protein [Micromonospora chersina]|uniref:hypothetical protein n=1 Tax=Micromonospora chersina TaxID=47854 RepID=UPI00371F0E26
MTPSTADDGGERLFTSLETVGVWVGIAFAAGALALLLAARQEFYARVRTRRCAGRSAGTSRARSPRRSTARESSAPCWSTAAGGSGVGIALACFVGAAILWIVPDRRIDRAVREHETPA